MNKIKTGNYKIQFDLFIFLFIFLKQQQNDRTNWKEEEEDDESEEEEEEEDEEISELTVTSEGLEERWTPPVRRRRIKEDTSTGKEKREIGRRGRKG